MDGGGGSHLREHGRAQQTFDSNNTLAMWIFGVFWSTIEKISSKIQAQWFPVGVATQFGC